jgi:hypothetical protein
MLNISVIGVVIFDILGRGSDVRGFMSEERELRGFMSEERELRAFMSEERELRRTRRGAVT